MSTHKLESMATQRPATQLENQTSGLWGRNDDIKQEKFKAKVAKQSYSMSNERERGQFQYTSLEWWGMV